MISRQPTRLPPMAKPRYLLAILCYIALPAVLVGGIALSFLIDPEMARHSSDYTRNYRLLDNARLGVLLAAVALALGVWAAVCYLVLKARQRSLGWLLLAAAGPFGFIGIAALRDRAPAPADRYQRFIAGLKPPKRLALEAAVFVSVWLLAALAVGAERSLAIAWEAYATGVPVATIIAVQDASGGMWAFREGLEALYFVVLIYLLWPIGFNLAGRVLKRSPANA